MDTPLLALVRARHVLLVHFPQQAPPPALCVLQESSQLLVLEFVPPVPRVLTLLQVPLLALLALQAHCPLLVQLHVLQHAQLVI